MNIQQILERLPHRYPFLLVDRVLEVDHKAQSLRAIKNVTFNEPFFNGHFPQRPVMPGVLMLEALAQTCGLLGMEIDGSLLDKDSLFYFVGIDAVRFKRVVIPGDQLELVAVFERMRAGIYRYQCKASVDGELAVEAILMCTVRKNA